MGVLNIQKINSSLQINERNARRQGGSERKNDIGAEPVDLHTRVTLGMGQSAKNRDYDGFQLLKPLGFINNPNKTSDFLKLWNI